MKRVILVLLGAVVVSLVPAACGAGSTSSSTPQPVVTVTVTSGPHTPTAEATTGNLLKGTIGDTLTLAGLDDSKVEVTLKKTERVPAESESGVEMHPALYGVLVSVRNVAETTYTDYAGALSIVDDADVAYENPQTYSDLPDQLSELVIAPGDVRSGWVYFEVPAKRNPRLLQFTANSMNVDYSETQIGEWSLQ